MKDLSSLATWAKGLTAGESMGAGNTINLDKTAMQAPGSSPVDPLPDVTDDATLEVPAISKPTTLVKPGSAIPASGAWKKAGE